jgi:phosphomannomutase
MTIPENLDLTLLKKELAHHFPKGEFNEIDGLKLDLEDAWIHLRKSNTEPIVRIYAEAKEEKSATKLVKLVKELVNKV